MLKNNKLGSTIYDELSVSYFQHCSNLKSCRYEKRILRDVRLFGNTGRSICANCGRMKLTQAVKDGIQQTQNNRPQQILRNQNAKTV